MKNTFILFTFLLLLNCDLENTSSTEGIKEDAIPSKTLLAIFAHPDDETTIGPVLAKYAEQQSDVYLLITTDGRYGVTNHAEIPAGDSLVRVRNKELECSCKALGIHPPIQLNVYDGLRGIEGMSGIFSELALMKERMKAEIKKINPDVIITFGPEGDSGHPDHRLVGAVTTEILLSEPWPEGMKLYYFSWEKAQAEQYEGWNLNYADSANLNTVVTFDESHEKKHFASIQCHQSQYSQEDMAAWIELEKQMPNRLYFRELVISKEKKDGF